MKLKPMTVKLTYVEWGDARSYKLGHVLDHYKDKEGATGGFEGYLVPSPPHPDFAAFKAGIENPWKDKLCGMCSAAVNPGPNSGDYCDICEGGKYFSFEPNHSHKAMKEREGIEKAARVKALEEAAHRAECWDNGTYEGSQIALNIRHLLEIDKLRAIAIKADHD